MLPFVSTNPAGLLARLSQRVFAQTHNYDQPDGPFYSGDYASGDYAEGEPDNSAELVVVTYNLRYGEATAEAVAAWRETGPLPAADIVLLQEMDEAGVETIARELGYNYVYYPASVAEDGDDFGNAILARRPISDPAKLILPGLHPRAVSSARRRGRSSMWATPRCWSIQPTSRSRWPRRRCARGSLRPSSPTSPTTRPTSSSAAISTPSPGGG